MSKKVAILVWGLIFCICAGCAVNPISGQRQLMLISEQQDVEIGRQYAPEIEKQMGGRIPNSTLQNYVNHVGQRIVQVSHKRDLTYQFVALNDNSINAFALPGGYIFITKGMLQNLRSEAQLAAILGHETVHVVARHSSAAMSNQIGMEMLLSAVISEDAPRSVATIATLTNQIIGLQYSRSDERESDLAGVDYMVQAGYNPYAMVETMQMLERQQQTRPIEFLSSHPSPENRVEYITQKIQSSNYNLSGLKTGESDYSTNVLQQLR